MKINDEYEIVIDNEDYIGNGVTRINNFVTFILDGLKGEIVKVKIIYIFKRYAIAEITELVKKSEYRIEPSCKIYNKCGGCNFLHTTLDNEINIKKEYLERLFKRKIDYYQSKNEYNYRNKVVLHVLKGKIGYYSDKTHDLREFDSCMLLNPKINSKIADLKKYNLNGINEISIRCINNEIMLNIVGDIKDKKLNNIECDSLYINNKYIKGKKYLIDEINNLKFSIYPNSFYQVNREIMSKIYDKAKEYLGNGNNLLDLYCGTGTIGIWMKDNYKNITGIEINEDSIKNANINKELNNIKNINFICGDAKIAKGNYDAIIVDPPRNGLSLYVIDFINKSKSNKVIYISCNPKTLQRDTEFLEKYEIKDISAYSMFPRTKHIECVCLLERK